MSRDIASAYIASISRIGSWVIVSALVYRYVGAAEFAMLALVRGTIGLLNYVSLGLAPALIHQAARLRSEPVPSISGDAPSQGKWLSYNTPPPQDSPLQTLYSNALSIGLWTGITGFLLSLAYAGTFEKLYRVPSREHGEMWAVVLPIGVGIVLRLISDVPGALLQVRGMIARDNTWLAVGDVFWMILSACYIFPRTDPVATLENISIAYGLSGVIVFLGRWGNAGRETGILLPRFRQTSFDIQRYLLAYGALVVAAQLADYLYAPTDYILIDRLLSPLDIANYAPGVQIDSGLLLLVMGLSNVLLPKAALAHAGGSARTVRQYYLRGTLVSMALLSVASLFIWLASPWLFRLWFGNSMPGTREILPLMLLNTVIGGSAAVGRSILLAVGKAKPFAIAALVAGITNVACSYAFVRYLHWGLRGIILGTIVAVVGRCMIWMPWYVMKTLRQPGGNTLQIEN
jgi:O-antigen/teichoic acid export membrane protein